MQMLYLVAAMTMSIGVGMFAGPDIQRANLATAGENRAVAFQEQAQIYARSVRRDIRMNPSAYRANPNSPVQISDEALDRAEFGGYQMSGRFRVALLADGSIVPQLTSSALNGPNGLGDESNVVAELVLNPRGKNKVGTIDLAKAGVRISR